MTNPAPSKIFLVQGEHQTVPGRPLKAFHKAADADAEALELVNLIRSHTVLPPATENWQQALFEAQRTILIDEGVIAENEAITPEKAAELCEADVWIDHLDVN